VKFNSSAAATNDRSERGLSSISAGRFGLFTQPQC
jgi:hypothetical protein